MMSTLANTYQKQLARETAVASKVPYAYFVDEKTIETKDGHLLQAIKVNGLVADTLDDDLLDREKHLRNVLLMSVADANTAIYVHTIRKPVTSLLGGYYANAFSRQLHEKWQAKLKEKSFYITEHYLTVVKKPPMVKISKPADLLVSFSRAANKQAREQYRQNELKILNKTVHKIMSNLSRYGVYQLTNKQSENGQYDVSELMTFLGYLVNADERELALGEADLSTLLGRHRLFFDESTGTMAFKNASNKTRYAAILSIKNYSAMSYAGMFDQLFDLTVPMIMSQSFSFVDKSSSRKAIKEAQREMAQSDDGLTSETLKISDTLDTLGSGQSVFGNHQLSILTHANDLTALEKQVQLIDATLNELGMMAIREDAGLKAAFWSSLPANQAYLARKAGIHSKNMAAFASLHNASTGKAKNNHWGEAVTLLETMSGSPYYFNFHVLDVGNTFLVGPMGSGKTLLESFLLSESMKAGGRLYIFDKDRSMEAFVRVMGGSYGRFEAGKRTGFAPFQIEDTTENRYFLAKLIKLMLKISGYVENSESDQIISRVIEGAYQLPKQDRVLRHIVPFFGMNQAGSMRTYMEKWVGKGLYAWVFDHEQDDFAMKRDVMGFDMTTVLTDEICPVIYFYIFHHLEMAMDGTRTRIVIAEGWRALEEPLFREKIKDWSSTPRKKEGLLILDTQSPDEIAQSPVGCKVIQESVTQIFFANIKAERHVYIDKFGLTEKEFQIVKNLDTEARYFLLKQGKSSVVVKLDLSGFQLDLPILSCRLPYLPILDRLLLERGEEPKYWMADYCEEASQLKEEKA